MAALRSLASCGVHSLRPHARASWSLRRGMGVLTAQEVDELPDMKYNPPHLDPSRPATVEVLQHYNDTYKQYQAYKQSLKTPSVHKNFDAMKEQALSPYRFCPTPEDIDRVEATINSLPDIGELDIDAQIGRLYEEDEKYHEDLNKKADESKKRADEIYENMKPTIQKAKYLSENIDQMTFNELGYLLPEALQRGREESLALNFTYDPQDFHEYAHEHAPEMAKKFGMPEEEYRENMEEILAQRDADDAQLQEEARKKDEKVERQLNKEQYEVL